MRLNKYISETGLCSRREADALIAAGRVTINDQPIELGTQVNKGDEVCVDGKRVQGRARDAEHATRRVYIALTSRSASPARPSATLPATSSTLRSEERRVGKEGGSKCGYRGSRTNKK